MRIFLVGLFSIVTLLTTAQKKQAWVSGKVVDDNDNSISNVSITILGKSAGALTNDSGYFKIKVTADKALALIFSHSGYTDVQKNFYLSNNEEEKITVKLNRGGKVLETVVISDERERKEAGLNKNKS